MEINVMYGANDEFSKYTYFSIFSLLSNTNKTDIINCYLFTTEKNKRLKSIKKLEKYYHNFKFYAIYGDEKKIKNLKTSKTISHLNYNTYRRFFCNQLNQINKIIYLDSDTIVLGNIKELYNENLDGNIIGIVSDSPIELINNIKSEIGLNKEKYFNSGVMLIDLQKRKKFKVSEKCLDLLSRYNYPCNDQDALNIVLKDNCKYLDGKYNVQTSFLNLNNENFFEIGFGIEFYKEAAAHPEIIHYTGTNKPWFLLDNHPYRQEYDKTVLIAILKSLKHINILPLRFKDYLITQIHTIENILFPKRDTKRKIRKYIMNTIPIGLKVCVKKHYNLF